MEGGKIKMELFGMEIIVIPSLKKTYLVTAPNEKGEVEILEVK